MSIAPAVNLLFNHDSHDIPTKAEETKPLTINQVSQLADAVANFYAQFLSSDWRKEQHSKIPFHAIPAAYPSTVCVEKFKKKLTTLIVNDYNKIDRTMRGWFIMFTTHYAPEKILDEACHELEIDFHHNLGVFFPTKSNLSLKFDVQKSLLSVSWIGEKVW